MTKTGDLERARREVCCKACLYWKYSKHLSSEQVQIHTPSNWPDRKLPLPGKPKEKGYCRFNREAEEVVEYPDSVCGNWLNEKGQNPSEYLKETREERQKNEK